MTARQQQLDKYQGGADSDGGVCDIEGPDVPISPVHVDKVHDESLPDPIGQVADGATENERQAKARKTFVRPDMSGVVSDAGQGQNGERGRHHAPLWMRDVV